MLCGVSTGWCGAAGFLAFCFRPGVVSVILTTSGIMPVGSAGVSLPFSISFNGTLSSTVLGLKG